MPPIAAVIAGIVASAVTAGTSIYQAQDYKGPDTNQAALDATAAKTASDQQATKDAASLESQKTALLQRAAPDAQAATGGSLAPDAYASFTSLLAGLPGDLGLAQKLLNPSVAGPGANSGLTPSGTNSMSQMPVSGMPASPMSGSSMSGGGASSPDPQSIIQRLASLFNGGGQDSNSISGGDSGMGMESLAEAFA